jgi:hypothetical protein
MATGAGRAGQPNEDFAGAVPGAVLLDGAGIPATESICSRGVAWYTHRLGGAQCRMRPSASRMSAAPDRRSQLVDELAQGRRGGVERVCGGVEPLYRVH